MTVASMLSEKGRAVFTILPQTAMSKVIDELALRKIGAIVVTEADGSVCGIVSERDVVREIASGGPAVLEQPISNCMTKKVVSCKESDTVDQVMGVMTDHRFRHMPVITDGHLVGIISIGDVVKRKIEQAERDAEELRNYIATG